MVVELQGDVCKPQFTFENVKCAMSLIRIQQRYCEFDYINPENTQQMWGVFKKFMQMPVLGNII